MEEEEGETEVLFDLSLENDDDVILGGEVSVSSKSSLEEASKNTEKEIQLFESCRTGNLNEVSRLVNEEYVDVNCRDETSMNRTPLHHAAFYNHLEICHFLKESGAHIDAITTMEETPLFLAVTEGNLEIVKYLVSENCRIDVPSKLSKETCLHSAVKNGFFRISLFLILGCARTDLQDSTGKIAENYAPFEIKSVFSFTPPKEEITKKRISQGDIRSIGVKTKKKKSVEEEEEEEVDDDDEDKNKKKTYCVDWYEVKKVYDLLETEITVLEEKIERYKEKLKKPIKLQESMESRAGNEEVKFLRKQNFQLRKKYSKLKDKMKRYKNRVEKLRNEKDELKIELKEQHSAVDNHLKQMDKKLQKTLKIKKNKKKNPTSESGEEDLFSMNLTMQKEILEKTTLTKKMGKEIHENMEKIKHLREVDEIRKIALKEKDKIIETLENQLNENKLRKRCAYCKNYKCKKYYCCGYCKTLYCSKECQKKDWVVNNHKSFCSKKKKELKENLKK